MYYFLLAALILFSVVEIVKGDKKGILFHIAIGLLTMVLCLRYGQGTDYFGYMCNYDGMDFHSEVGFVLIEKVLKRLGVPFEVFVVLMALAEMGCLYRAISLYSPVKNFSLLLFYPTLYLTYSFSGMRQGMVIMFFLGFMLKWLQEKQYGRYVIATLLLCTVHSAAIILLPLVVLDRIKVKWLHIGIIMGVFAGVLIYVIPSEIFSAIDIGDFQYYFETRTISAMGLLERIVMMGVVAYFVWRIREGEVDAEVSFLYKVYVCGFIVSLIFFPWSLFSSRLGAMMKATEILLFPILIKKVESWKRLLISYLVVYTSVMTVKNIGSYIQQSGYVGYNVFTYPYLSVFDREEAHQIRRGEYEHYLWYVDMYGSKE